MDLFQIFKELDKNEDIHLGRLLILINAFSEEDNSKKIEGLTKLAKLDFLLRYPNYLEIALRERGRKKFDLQIKEYERTSVESKMVRYKYGPWDFRYRKFINLLIGKGLVEYEQKGKTINIGITKRGKDITNSLIESKLFDSVNIRANLIRKNFDIGASALMRFIYSTFPEIGDLKMGSNINSGKNEI